MILVLSRRLATLQPYGATRPVTKKECCNHMHKRFGTALRNAAKSQSLGGRGAGRLTKEKCTRLQNYFRGAILNYLDDEDKSVSIINWRKITIILGKKKKYSFVYGDPTYPIFYRQPYTFFFWKILEKKMFYINLLSLYRICDVLFRTTNLFIWVTCSEMLSKRKGKWRKRK